MSPQAGWYQDPENPAQQRWWDGSQWAAPSAPPAMDPPTPPMPPTPSVPPTGYASVPPVPPDAYGAAGYGAPSAPGPYGGSLSNAGVAAHSGDRVGDAVAVIKGAFWRLLGLVSIATGVVVIGFIVLSVVVRSAFETSSGSLSCEFGSSCASTGIGLVLMLVAVIGAITALSLWVNIAAVRLVRGQQAGVRVGVGQALGETWPRAWRGIALSVALTVVMLVVQAVLGKVGDAAVLILLPLVLVAYTIFVGLYAWMASPPTAETSGR